MNISHITPTMDRSDGGPPRSVDDLITALASLNAEDSFHLHTISSSNPISTPEEASYEITTHSKSITGHFLRLGSKLIEKSPDVLHIHTTWPMFLHRTAVEARKHGIPYIISPRGMLEPWSLNQKKWKKKIALQLYQKKDLNGASCIHATCETEAVNLRDLGFLNPIAIIPNGIKLNYFPLKFTGGKNQKKILFLSRVHPKKGLELLIDAWHNLTADIRNGWVIEIVGNGDKAYIESLERLIKNKRLEKSVVMRPPVYGKDKVRLYQNASLFILPTYSENFGIVVAEALACGTPVITTKGAPWSDLQKYNCGWWTDIDRYSIQNALHEAMGMKQEELEQMGMNGRKLVKNQYDIRVIAQQMFHLYQWIYGKNSKPDFIV